MNFIRNICLKITFWNYDISGVGAGVGWGGGWGLGVGVGGWGWGVGGWGLGGGNGSPFCWLYIGNKDVKCWSKGYDKGIIWV